ncbi:helix-turn-helix transcriptional regulator [Nocardia cyriacigeorgica]|uniref:Helix-turn-helix transcriptional regulator n=1 Tax=Nocardia cyriacigeorgica TaxID=135487 RepID=A0ABX0CQL0_9NOCA|nr:helix-turn-helix domain-containing protein [Nocardia cyriacigeorgica]NEW58778.1 helix-turn-helix transcriptional regulator [Nocardia cyriacigeorgica]
MIEQRYTIGEYVRERRHSVGMSCAELAARARIPRVVVEEVESGAREHSSDTMTQLFDALQVPVWFRGHITSLTRPDFLPAGLGTVPACPTRDDLADLHSLTHPACFQVLPTFDIIAANSAYQRWFPGVEAGTNLLEWMFLNPVAKTVLPEWFSEARLLVNAFRVMSPGLADDKRIAEIADTCSRAPEWEQMWAAALRPEDLHRDRVLVRDPVNRRERGMIVRIYAPEFPLRPWMLYRLVPGAGR